MAASLFSKTQHLRIQTLAKALIIVTIILGLFSGENWLLRGIAITLFCISFLVAFIPMIASGRFAFVVENSKIARRHSQRTRRVVEVIARIAFLGLGLFIVRLLFYLCLDFGGVAKTG